MAFSIAHTTTSILQSPQVLQDLQRCPSAVAGQHADGNLRELEGTAAVIRSHDSHLLANHSSGSTFLVVPRVLGSLCEHFCSANSLHDESRRKLLGKGSF